MPKNNLSTDQLHTNYIRLAKLLHPDVSGNTHSSEAFKDLQQEYNKIMSDNKIDAHYQVTVGVSLKEAIEGTQRYFVNDENFRYVLNIPAGIKNNQEILYKSVISKANKNISLKIKILINLPTKFSIINGILVYREHISFWKLIFGGTHVFFGPDNKKITIKIPNNTKNGKMFMIQNSGLWNSNYKKRDPLYIQIFGFII